MNLETYHDIHPWRSQTSNRIPSEQEQQPKAHQPPRLRLHHCSDLCGDHWKDLMDILHPVHLRDNGQGHRREPFMLRRTAARRYNRPACEDSWPGAPTTRRRVPAVRRSTTPRPHQRCRRSLIKPGTRNGPTGPTSMLAR